MTKPERAGIIDNRRALLRRSAYLIANKTVSRSGADRAANTLLWQAKLLLSP